MDDPCPRARIEEIAQEVRAFLEPHWTCWHEREGTMTVPLSRGTCDRSSLFLGRVLQDRGLPAIFVTGAPSTGAFGYLWNGVWQGHAWVECAGLVIDVTADQFGGPRVRIVPADDARYSGGEDVADVEIALMREQAVARLQAHWLARDGRTDCGAVLAPAGK